MVTLGAPWPRAQIASWAHDEVTFLAQARRHGAAAVGVCFGAQVLAESLGSGTTSMTSGRIGWRSVRPHAPGISTGPWFQWHAEQLVAPPGAEVLAESADGVEAFRLGRCAGVQFHPEMTPALLERWLALPGGAPPALDVGPCGPTPNVTPPTRSPKPQHCCTSCSVTTADRRPRPTGREVEMALGAVRACSRVMRRPKVGRRPGRRRTP